MEEKDMTVGQRFIGVILRPKETFEIIGKEPKVLVPALIIIVINVVLVGLIIPETREFTEEVLLKTPGMTPDAVQAGLKGAAFGMIAGVALLPPLIWLVQAAILALFNQFSVGEARFKQLFAVAVYAWIPPFIGGAIKPILTKLIGFKSAMAIRASFALFLPGSWDSGFWFVFLSKLDFFSIWGLVLLSIGGAAVMNKDSKKVGFYVFGLWLAWSALMAYFSAKYGNITGM